MKRKNDFAAPRGTMNTVPGSYPPAVHGRADPVRMQTTEPGTVPHIPELYDLAVSGDADAQNALIDLALFECPEAQRMLGYLHLAKGNMTSAEAWFRKSAAHGDECGRAAFAGVLMERACDGDMSVFAELVPLLIQFDAEGYDFAAPILAEYRHLFGDNVEAKNLQ